MLVINYIHSVGLITYPQIWMEVSNKGIYEFYQQTMQEIQYRYCACHMILTNTVIHYTSFVHKQYLCITVTWC